MINSNSEAQFDKWSATYDHDVQDESSFPFSGYTRVLNRVISLAQIESGMEVLELGAGTGNLTGKLIDAGAAVWALDFSADMLAIAKKKVPGAQFGQADLQADFPPRFRRKYDRIVSTYTFHEIPFPAKIELLHRLVNDYLVQGGRIVIGDIGFVNADARESVRIASAEAWDDEFYWIRDETMTVLNDKSMALAWEQISSCGVVIEITCQHY